MAFDFFNISGSLFVETSTNAKTRSSAQGLFMMMTNGFGAVFGSLVSGWMIDKYFTNSFQNISAVATYVDSTTDNSHLLSFVKSHGINILSDGSFDKALLMKDWQHIWLSFTIYALVVTVLFAIMFKHKHTRAEEEAINKISH
ncbi:hypothetical protein [Pedobacter sp. UBA4863]|nr:hypothetical protein [Pedobacter sp. UBA4863]